MKEELEIEKALREMFEESKAERERIHKTGLAELEKRTKRSLDEIESR